MKLLRRSVSHYPLCLQDSPQNRKAAEWGGRPGLAGLGKLGRGPGEQQGRAATCLASGTTVIIELAAASRSHTLSSCQGKCPWLTCHAEPLTVDAAQLCLQDLQDLGGPGSL